MIALKICFTEEKLTRSEESEVGTSMLFELISSLAPEISEPVIVRTDTGKPYIKDSDVTYSVSHTDGCITVALSVPSVCHANLPPLSAHVLYNGVYLLCEDGFSDLGVDCEAVDDKKSEEWLLRMAKRYFSASERKAFDASGDKRLEFYRIWTSKEALVKCTGEGIFGSFRDTAASTGGHELFRFTLEHGGRLYCGAVCGKK